MRPGENRRPIDPWQHWGEVDPGEGLDELGDSVAERPSCFFNDMLSLRMQVGDPPC